MSSMLEESEEVLSKLTFSQLQALISQHIGEEEDEDCPESTSQASWPSLRFQGPDRAPQVALHRGREKSFRRKWMPAAEISEEGLPDFFPPSSPAAVSSTTCGSTREPSPSDRISSSPASPSLGQVKHLQPVGERPSSGFRRSLGRMLPNQPAIQPSTPALESSTIEAGTNKMVAAPDIAAVENAWMDALSTEDKKLAKATGCQSHAELQCEKRKKAEREQKALASQQQSRHNEKQEWYAKEAEKKQREKNREEQQSVEGAKKEDLKEGVVEAYDDGSWWVEFDKNTWKEGQGQYVLKLCEKHLNDSSLEGHIGSEAHKKKATEHQTWDAPILLSGEEAWRERTAALPEGMIDPVSVLFEAMKELDSSGGRADSSPELEPCSSARRAFRKDCASIRRPETAPEEDVEARSLARGRNWRGVHRLPVSLEAPTISHPSSELAKQLITRPLTGPGTLRARQLGCAEGMSTQYSCRSEAWWKTSASSERRRQGDFSKTTLDSQHPEFDTSHGRLRCSCKPSEACEHWPSGRPEMACNLPPLPGAEGGKADGLGLSLEAPAKAPLPAWLKR
eukprot:TRINITY_DN1674_c0_g2_i2.p1 TRINITY_DN1674_c0_g2~~TRINITY_DN1674_c0_g2_i2.p1  ORF type:complete len:566 (-),score=139.24 TRINITY_DN1674_c0_g2_i2:179-1876(-)